MPPGQWVMLKLTLPEQDGFYTDLVHHPDILRIVALSGGYSRDEANSRLRKNPGIVASFSAALLQGLSARQSDAEFNAVLDRSIQSVFDAAAIELRPAVREWLKHRRRESAAADLNAIPWCDRP